MTLTEPNRRRPSRRVLLLPIPLASSLCFIFLFSLYHFGPRSGQTLVTRTSFPIPVKCFPTKLPPIQPPPTIHPKVHPLEHKAFVSNYVPFHNFHRNCLQTSGPRFPCAKALIWTCPMKNCAGAGDRIRGIQFAFMYAVATKRVFFIDWTHPAALETALVPSAIDWTLPDFVKRKLKKGTRAPNLDVPRLAWFRSMGPQTGLNGGIYTASVTHLMGNVTRANYDSKKAGGVSIDLLKDDVSRIAEDEHVLAMESRLTPRLAYVLLNPYTREVLFRDRSEQLRNEIANQTVELYFRQMLTKTLFAPSSKVQEILRRRKAELQGRYDAVHARLGEDVRESSHDRFREANKNLNKAAQALLRCLEVASQGNKTDRVFLAMDSTRFKRVFVEAAQKMGIRVGVNNKKAIHLDQAWGGEDVCDDYRELFADAYMLAGGRRLVGSLSGFGNMASSMGDVEVFVDTLFLAGNRCERKWGKQVTLDEADIRRRGGR